MTPSGNVLLALTADEAATLEFVLGLVMAGMQASSGQSPTVADLQSIRRKLAGPRGTGNSNLDGGR